MLLLTDANVTELHVETDPHKCGFGKWYYSDARIHAEEMVPELKSLFAEIEEPHTIIFMNQLLKLVNIFSRLTLN